MSKHPKINSAQHSKVMREHRLRKRNAGYVDLRFGWGSEVERAALKKFLEALRDPSNPQIKAAILAYLDPLTLAAVSKTVDRDAVPALQIPAPANSAVETKPKERNYAEEFFN
jgi:hypothetical protein